MANGGFRQRLEGLLGGQSNLGNLGIGLLAASGPRAQGTSNVGSRIGEAAQFAQQRERAALQNQAVRDAMLQRQRQQQAQQQIQGILSAPERVPQGQPLPAGQGVMATRDQRQPEMMGLLAQAAPAQFTQGLLDQAFATQAPTEFKSPIGKMLGDLEAAEQTGNAFATNQIRTAIEQQLGDDTDLNDVRSVRNDLISNSEQFLTAQQGFQRVVTGAQSGTAAGDLAVTFGIMKLLDPTSVVREGEQATVRNAGGVPERIRNMYNSIITGETLTPEQRQDFVNQAQAQFSTTVDQQNRLIEDAHGFAERNNLPSQDVIPEFITPIQFEPVDIQIPTPEPTQRTLRNPLTQRERDELSRLRRELGLGGSGG